MVVQGCGAGLWCRVAVLVPGRQRQTNRKFKASLGYIVS